MKTPPEPTKFQRWTTYAMVVALAASLTSDVLAFIERRWEAHNWNRAIAEDMDKAKAEADKVDG